MLFVISAPDNCGSGPWLMVVTTALISHRVIIFWSEAHDSPPPGLCWVLSSLDRGQRSHSAELCCKLHHDSLQPLVRSWLTALQPLVRSWLTADRGWRLLRDSGQSAGWSLPESFPSLKIFRNCNDFFRTKWLIDEVQKPLIIVPVIDSNYYFVTRDRWIIRHCQCPLRPGFWLSATWLSFNGHSLGLMDASPEWTKCWHQGQSGAVSHTAIWIITAASSAEFRSNYLFWEDYT